MSKRAGIYIRVSSESQAEKISPQAQEQDCISYCGSHDYRVVEVYRDIEKYRVGKKLVEPSGTRADRPQFKRMLADARAGLFDIVIAWREDRLYRSYRPMLDFLDMIEETKVDCELVKDYFNKNIAPVKAWAAHMELDAKHERFMMGVIGRLKAEKLWCSRPVYGYDYINGAFVINKEEAGWVYKICQWFGEGVTIAEIRRRLINSAAPQKGRPVKYLWSPMTIRSILKRDDYGTGIFTVKWNNEIYEINVPVILPEVIYRSVKNRFAVWKAYPAGNYINHTLSGGLVRCAACDVMMRTTHTVAKNKLYKYWRCTNYMQGIYVPGCARIIPITRLDTEVWERVWELISKPGVFEQKLQARIDSLQVEECDAQGECDKIQNQLAELMIERDWVITQARKRHITEDAMKVQLMGLYQEENELRKEYNEKRLLVGNRAESLIALVDLFRERTMTGYENINAQPATAEAEKEQFDFKEKLIHGIVKRIEVFEDRSIKVHTELGEEELQEFAIDNASL